MAGLEEIGENIVEAIDRMHDSLQSTLSDLLAAMTSVRDAVKEVDAGIAAAPGAATGTGAVSGAATTAKAPQSGSLSPVGGSIRGAGGALAAEALRDVARVTAAGAQNALNGGTFFGGAANAFNEITGSIPFIGGVFNNLTGGDVSLSVAKGVASDLSSLEGAVAAGAQFDDATLKQLAEVSAQQNQRVAEFRKRAAAIGNDVSGGDRAAINGASILSGLKPWLDLFGVDPNEGQRTINGQMDQSGIGVLK